MATILMERLKENILFRRIMDALPITMKKYSGYLPKIKVMHALGTMCIHDLLCLLTAKTSIELGMNFLEL